RDALRPEVRPDRVVRAADLLAVRVLGAADRARGLRLPGLLPPARLAGRDPAAQLRLRRGVLPGLAGLRHPGERLRRARGGVAVPLRDGRPAAGGAAPVLAAARGLHPAALRGARDAAVLLPAPHALLADARA